jgi:cytochrome c oxidase subunit 3
VSAAGQLLGDAGTEAPRTEAAQLGMWIFLAGEMLFFGALVVAYFVARGHSPQGFVAASARTALWLGTLNTAVLLTSSFAVALAAQAATADRPRESARWLWIAVALGLGFLVVKGIEYRHEWQAHLYPGAGFELSAIGGAELFFAWYFVVTGLHAVHLGIGIVLCAGCALAMRWAGRKEARLPARVHAVALYWHFVDIVWIVLFPLIYLVAPRQ